MADFLPKSNSHKAIACTAGATEISRITLRNRQIGYNEIDEGQYEIREAIPYMHGAAMLIPQSVIKKVGKMSECYFLYYEEIDWSERIRKHFDLCYFPNFTIYHKESNSVGENSPLKTFISLATDCCLLIAIDKELPFVYQWFICFLWLASKNMSICSSTKNGPCVCRLERGRFILSDTK